MNLIPWTRHKALSQATPLEPHRLRDEMDRVLDRFFARPWSSRTEDLFFMEEPGFWVPVTDVSETDDAITIRTELPGIDPEQIEVSVRGDVLTLSGRKEEASERKGEDYHHSERRFGSFRRSIELPSSADAEHVTARYRNGVLSVEVPKLESEPGRKVPVESSAGETPAVTAAIR